MTLDFRASQIQTNKIISSGSSGTSTGASLLIYPHTADDNTAPNQGYINQSVFNTGSVGTDIFLYVSGGISKKDVGNSHAITCFGGDVHISGNLTIDGSSPSGGGSNFFWSPSNPYIEASGSLYISGSFRTTKISSSNGGEITGSFINGDSANIASGQYSHAEGTTNTASGYAAHAEGGGTIAFGAVSHAEGADTIAQGDRSHAEGDHTLAAGFGAHSEGYYATGSGNYSHAEGSYTTASGSYSHAEGIYTFSIGQGSHSEGIGTIASGSSQHVQGKYNKRNNDFSLFVIGDGTGDGDAIRGDIVRVNPGSAIGKGRVEITGSFVSTLGLSGSLQTLSDGSPYLLAGTNITITTNSLGQIEITGSAPATSIGTLQQTYNAGIATIGLNNASGSITISGSLTPISTYNPPLLKLQPGINGPYFYNHSAIDIFGFNVFTPANSASLINLRGNGSNFGGGEITLRSTGDVNGRIGWVAGSGELYGSSPNASIQYHASVDTLKLSNENSTGKVSIVNTYTGGQALFVVQNGTTYLGGDRNSSAISFFPDSISPFYGAITYGTVYNSGSFVQSGSATFKNQVQITGSLSVSGSGGNNGTLNQYNGLRYYPKIVTSLPYTASLNDYIIAVSASAGPGIQLPSSEFGRTFIVKDVSGSAATDLITITAAGGELIDGSPTATIGIDNGSYTFVYFGSGIGWGTI